METKPENPQATQNKDKATTEFVTYGKNGKIVRVKINLDPETLRTPPSRQEVADLL